MICGTHPKYRGSKKPRTDCPDCWTIYETKQEITDSQLIEPCKQHPRYHAIQKPSTVPLCQECLSFFELSQELKFLRQGGKNAQRLSPASIMALEFIRRFPGLGKQTIAKMLVAADEQLFRNDVQFARDRVRYLMGAKGDRQRLQRVHQGGEDVFHLGAVELPPTRRKVHRDYHLKPKFWAVFADIHFPFHEPMAVRAAIAYAKAEKVEGILFNGDLLDAQACSYWRSSTKRDFNADLLAVIDFLDWIRQEFPDAEIVYKPGNHEARLPNYIMSNSDSLNEAAMISWQEFLGLEARGIEFLEYQQKVLAGKLPIFHGDEFSNIHRTVNPARGLFLRAKKWCMIGHCHTTSEHMEKDVDGLLLPTWSLGCLCDLSPDYARFGNNWNWGFALINVEAGGDFEVFNKKILPDGRVR